MKQKILNLFAEKERLRFSDIEKRLAVRTNHLAYHLKKMIENKMIEKRGEGYFLSPEKEQIIPNLSEKSSALPVVLVKIGKKGNFFLPLRKKRPYLNKLGLPGGRLLTGEFVESAAKRIMNEKYNIKIHTTNLKGIFLEHVRKDNLIKYSFVIFLVEAKSKSPIVLTSIKKVKMRIIKRDYQMLKSGKTRLKTIISR